MAFARFEEPALCGGQPLVGASLLGLEVPDRRARFLLTTTQAVALFFRLPPLARELLAPVREAPGFLDRVLQLRVVADDDLFLLVVFGIERRNRVRGVRNRRFELGGLSASRKSASRSS